MHIDISRISVESLDILLNASGWLINVSEFQKAAAGILLPRSAEYSYTKETVKKASAITREISGVSLVVGEELSNQDIPEGSLAYYNISGLVRADYPWDWYFSSKRLARQLVLAEGNPNIAGHFLHISSGGGEAWYLDRLFSVLTSLEKPLYAHIEKLCASAAYYIGCAAQRITAETPNCTVGSIGVMCQFTNMRGLMDKLGIKDIQLYADGSDLKNKKILDAFYNDKPEEFIRKELNPIREQFVDAVRAARPALSKLTDDHPVLRGEDYRAEEALTVGLIDGIQTLEQSLRDAHRAGLAYLDSVRTRTQALNFLNL